MRASFLYSIFLCYYSWKCSLARRMFMVSEYALWLKQVARYLRAHYGNLDPISVRREMRGAFHLVLDAMYVKMYPPAVLPSDAPNCLVLNGFGAPNFVYNPLRYFIEAGVGVRTHLITFDWSNPRGYLFQYVRDQETCFQTFQEIRHTFGKVTF